MRTQEFTFKKTVKKVKYFNAISVDLTVAEAEVLLATIEAGAEDVTDGTETPAETAIGDLYVRLVEFVEKHA